MIINIDLINNKRKHIYSLNKYQWELIYGTVIQNIINCFKKWCKTFLLTKEHIERLSVDLK